MKQTIDPNHVTRYENGVTTTPFEQHVAALAVVLLAAGYPADTRVRGKAVRACHNINIDYLETIARLVEQTGASVDQARWKIVEYIGSIVGEMRLVGGAPRDGILHDGTPANELGLPIDHDSDPEDY